MSTHTVCTHCGGLRGARCTQAVFIYSPYFALLAGIGEIGLRAPSTLGIKMSRIHFIPCEGKQSGQIYLRFTNEIKIVAGGAKEVCHL